LKNKEVNMRVFVKVLMFLIFCSILSVVAKADEVKIPMPDGAAQVVKTHRMYSTSNPANNLVEAVAANDLSMRIKTCWEIHRSPKLKPQASWRSLGFLKI
jgi:hypothetical protein